MQLERTQAHRGVCLAHRRLQNLDIHLIQLATLQSASPVLFDLTMSYQQQKSRRPTFCSALYGRSSTVSLHMPTYVATKSIRHHHELYSWNVVNWTPIFRSQKLNGPSSAMSNPIFATTYSLESVWRDLHCPYFRGLRSKTNVFFLAIICCKNAFFCRKIRFD